MFFSDLGHGKGNSLVKVHKVHLMNEFESKQVVIWTADWVATNESSSAFQYTTFPWLQVKLKFIWREFFWTCGFSLNAFGPPDFLDLI